jgi:aryl-alcohol dehydrogenase
MQIRAAVLYEKDAPFVVKDIELAAPKANEVLVKLAGCGVCHTDESVRQQVIPFPLPAVLGHEGAGIVEKVGAQVENLHPGDHVVFCQFSCGVCEQCDAGHPANCQEVGAGNFSGVYIDGTKRHKDENGVELSSFFSQSGFATHVVADQRNTIKIDDGIDLAIAGPLSCGINTGAGAVLNVLKPEAGSGFAVFGCGGVGLSAVMAAKAAGCTTIIGVDNVPQRLELALELGATDIVNSAQTEDVTEEIKRLSRGGVNTNLDTTGIPALVNAALFSLAPNGTTGVCATMGTRVFEIPLGPALMSPQKKLVGIVEGDATPRIFIPQLIRLHKAGLLPFDKLIKFYSLDEINQAFEDSRTGKTVKPVIKF